MKTLIYLSFIFLLTSCNLDFLKSAIEEANEVVAISQLYNEGQIDSAQKKLLVFTKLHTDNCMAWTVLGHTYFDQDNKEKAIEAYRNGIKADPKDFAPHNGLGLVYAKEGNYEKAMVEYKLADSFEPNNASIIGNIANLYDDMEDNQKSIEFGERSVQLDSTNATLCANLTVYYFNNEQYKDRNRMFMKTAALNYEDIQDLSDMVYPVDSTEGNLNFNGTISNAYTDAGIKDVKIEIANKDSIVVRKLFTDEEGKYKFVLPLEIADNYLVKVSYPNYIYKYFVVNTEQVPLEEWKSKAPEVVADIALSERIEGVDYLFLNKPLNRYFFNSAKNNFDYDKTLLDASIKKLKEMKSAEEKMTLKK